MDCVYDIRIRLTKTVSDKWGPPPLETVAKAIRDECLGVPLECGWRIVDVHGRESPDA